MKILHVANWCSGVMERNVRALKQYSRHSYEFVARIGHPLDLDYEMPTLLEKTTSKETVLSLIEEADALHFAAVGYEGTAALPETIHGIKFAPYRGKKLFILSGMCSMLTPDGKDWTIPHPERFVVPNLSHYDLLVGPHLSAKKTYQDRLEYVPDIIPIHDWLYTPAPGNPRRPHKATSFKGWDKVDQLQRQGMDFTVLPFPTKMAEQLAFRRKNVRMTLDNYTDGHWGLFGMESLSQGIPSATYIHPMNYECFDILEVPHPPFLEIEFGGGDLFQVFWRTMNMLPEDWNILSRRCRDWIERYYNPERLVKRWDAVYDKIGGKKPVEPPSIRKTLSAEAAQQTIRFWTVYNLEVAKRICEPSVDWEAAAERHFKAILTEEIRRRMGKLSTCRVLEIGCGIGRLLKLFAGKVGHATGIDITPQMVTLANEYLAEVKNASVQLCNGSSLPASTAGFNLIYSYGCLEYIPERGAIHQYLIDARKALKYDGILRIQTKRGVPAQKFRGNAGYYYASIEAFAEDIKQAGFNVVEREQGLTNSEHLWVTAVVGG